MTIVYFDSSAFVKLLVEEDGSELAAALWDGCDAAVAGRLGCPEVRAALAVARRDHRLTAADHRCAEAAFAGYWAATRMVELTDRVAERAGQLATDHALRGADAVHLASVLAVGADHAVLAVWDQRLRAGARAAGVQVVPAE
ncbi:MAG TPA: type II toxin-antitoxin system VapC family toxin [Jatrophihabitans sp.]|nr:type II toxin-antitoxin system VapC family toxin [Jatrophihabitans sp.]